MVLFSAAERRYCEPLLAGFAARHPDIEVEFVFGISGALHERYLREAASGGPTADLIWSSAMDLQMALLRDGHARPHGIGAALPDGAAYRDLALSTTAEPVVTLIRSEASPAGTPAEIAALLRARPDRFRGRVVLPDIEANGLGFLAMLHWSLAEPGFDAMLDALHDAAPRKAGSAMALVEGMEGAALGLHVLGAYARRAAAADATLSVAPSAAPPLAVARVAFIPARAAAPEAASLFLGYLVSPDGQAALDEAGLYPITRQAVPPLPIADGMARHLDETTRASLLSRWRAAIAA